MFTVFFHRYLSNVPYPLFLMRQKYELEVSVLYGVLTVNHAAGGQLNSHGRNTQDKLETKYTVGCFVHIFSTLTQEDYAGIITSITAEEVIVRLGTGTRLRVFVQQIKDRR